MYLDPVHQLVDHGLWWQGGGSLQQLLPDALTAGPGQGRGGDGDVGGAGGVAGGQVEQQTQLARGGDLDQEPVLLWNREAAESRIKTSTHLDRVCPWSWARVWST